MPGVTLLVPGDLATRTGGYAYDRAIVAGLGALGWTVDVCALDGSYPNPTAEARAATARRLAALPDGALVLADGLAFGAMPDDAAREAARLRLVALVHHPLALESGLAPETARALFESERRALQCTRGVVVTSPATVDTVMPYGVGRDRIAVVRPGTPHLAVAHGTRGWNPVRPDRPVALLTVATLTPRKGHDILVAALARLAGLPWHLTCAGSLTMHPPTVAAVGAALDAHGLTARVAFSGDLDEAGLAAAYDRADVFVLPTRHEGYGMVVAEAVAAGLPVVATPTGAIPDLVDASSGAIVPVDDVAALADALGAIVADDRRRLRLAEGARRRRDTLPRWDTAAREMAAALERFATHGILQR
jgi:glycosyltransferase involved in cell wall biosynthesis